VKIWDVAAARCVATLDGHKNCVLALAVLDGNRLASGSSDKTVKIWDVAAARCLVTLSGHTDGVKTLAVLDAGRLASGSCDKTIKLWSAHGSLKGKMRRSMSLAHDR
jgi:WD40 repeat protein